MTDPRVTVEGLVNGTSASSAADIAQWAVATGGVDTIAAAFDPAVTALTDGLILGFRASGANATATPTFAPDGLTAHTITRKGGSTLRPGHIPAALAEVLVRYNLANTRWELIDPYVDIDEPAVFQTAGGSANAIAATFSPPRLSYSDGALVRIRSTTANTSGTVTFAPDSLTARNIVRGDGTALQAGDITSGLDMLLEYDLTNTRWKLLNFSGRELFKRLIADDTGGTNVNTAQPWFPTAGSLVLPVGEYQFEGQLWLSRTAGTTSHTTALLFGGTATISVIGYFPIALTGDANALAATNSFFINVATATVIKSASTSATEQVLVRVIGTFTISVAGTIIPQFIYSTAPGGTPTVKAGTFFKVSPRVNPLGQWA